MGSTKRRPGRPCIRAATTTTKMVDVRVLARAASAAPTAPSNGTSHSSATTLATSARPRASDRSPGRPAESSAAPAIRPGTAAQAATRSNQVGTTAPPKSRPNTNSIHRGRLPPSTSEPATATRVAIREVASSRSMSDTALLTPKVTSRTVCVTRYGTSEMVTATTSSPSCSTPERGVTISWLSRAINITATEPSQTCDPKPSSARATRRCVSTASAAMTGSGSASHAGERRNTRPR